MDAGKSRFILNLIIAYQYKSCVHVTKSK